MVVSTRNQQGNPTDKKNPLKRKRGNQERSDDAAAETPNQNGQKCYEMLKELLQQKPDYVEMMSIAIQKRKTTMMKYIFRLAPEHIEVYMDLAIDQDYGEGSKLLEALRPKVVNVDEARTIPEQPLRQPQAENNISKWREDNEDWISQMRLARKDAGLADLGDVPCAYAEMLKEGTGTLKDHYIASSVYLDRSFGEYNKKWALDFPNDKIEGLIKILKSMVQRRIAGSN